ncbi:transposase [Lactiplantibacillus plantarum]|nr:transposase [Lactiplantibacillus plantarum]
MSQDHSTKVLLQIKDPNITNLVVQEATNGSLQVLAKLTFAHVVANVPWLRMALRPFMSEFLELANGSPSLT